jgi:hypothetical protein
MRCARRSVFSRTTTRRSSGTPVAHCPCPTADRYPTIALSFSFTPYVLSAQFQQNAPTALSFCKQYSTVRYPRVNITIHTRLAASPRQPIRGLPSPAALIYSIR